MESKTVILTFVNLFITIGLLFTSKALYVKGLFVWSLSRKIIMANRLINCAWTVYLQVEGPLIFTEFMLYQNRMFGGVFLALYFYIVFRTPRVATKILGTLIAFYIIFCFEKYDVFSDAALFKNIGNRFAKFVKN